MSCNAEGCREGVKGQISLISYCARINPFLSLTFAIIDTVWHGQVGNVISICLCTDLLLSLS